MFDKVIRCYLEETTNKDGYLVIVILGNKNTLESNVDAINTLARKFKFKRDALNCKMDIDDKKGDWSLDELENLHFQPYFTWR